MSAACMNSGKLSWARPHGETGFMYHKSLEQLPKDANLSWGYVCAAEEPLSWDMEFGVKIWFLHCWDFGKF